MQVHVVVPAVCKYKHLRMLYTAYTHMHARVCTKVRIYICKTYSLTSFISNLIDTIHSLVVLFLLHIYTLVSYMTW